jgi:hypothetical protein
MQTVICHPPIVARPFSDLESGDKFIMLKDIQSGGWSPLYTKIMENVQLNHPLGKEPLSVQAINSIGGMHHIKNDDLVIVVR